MRRDRGGHHSYFSLPGAHMDMSSRRRQAVVGFGIALALLMSLGLLSSPESAPPPVSTPTIAASPACGSTYTGTEECTGEPVLITQIVDAATVVLGDGRRVRLVGVAAAQRSGCAGPGSVAAAQQMITGNTMNLLRPVGFGLDEFGSQWGYLRAGPRDLGLALAEGGWATANAAGPASAGYAARIAAAEGAAQRASAGLFSSACTAQRFAVVTADRVVPHPQVRPKPAPDAQPAPKPLPTVEADEDRSDGATEERPRRTRTGHSGHPCLPGERDGDGDGYCKEGR